MQKLENKFLEKSVARFSTLRVIIAEAENTSETGPTAPQGDLEKLARRREARRLEILLLEDEAEEEKLRNMKSNIALMRK